VQVGRSSHGRGRAWDDDASVVRVDCFDGHESMEFLRRSGLTNPASALGTHLGHLPLALSLSAAYMLQCDVSCDQYLDLLAKGCVAFILNSDWHVSNVTVSLEKDRKIAHLCRH
jgi:hypothetical protein